MIQSLGMRESKHLRKVIGLCHMVTLTSTWLNWNSLSTTIIIIIIVGFRMHWHTCSEIHTILCRHHQVSLCLQPKLEHSTKIVINEVLWLKGRLYDNQEQSCLHFLLFRFEKRKEAGDTHYSIVGYMTVYQYYAYPDKIRPRIRYR